ncbi:MAG: thermonuclease family protein [Coprobacillus sp.]|nr:thermonuclease family protein [Coprobacillus sp.]
MKANRGKLLLFIPVITLLLGGVGTLTSCEEEHPRFDSEGNYTPYIDDKFVDYVHDGSVTLNHDYKGKNFWTDGIAEVTVFNYIDGDTTHFMPIDGNDSANDIIKARYYGIDTPESTGNVEKWGKEASVFTQEKLSEAKTIVVSTAQEGYGAPETDSTGSRYVSLVWISEEENCPYQDLVLLNLWIVQSGLSWVKNVLSMPDYVDTFYAAQNQAEAYKLCLWDDVTPPYWPGDEYVYVSLYELQLETKKDLEARENKTTYTSPWNNVRVIVEGSVASYTNNTIFLADYYDADWLNEFYEGRDDAPQVPFTEGVWAGINIFAGMSAVRSKYVERNTYLQLYALCQVSDNYGLQLTDVAGYFPAATSYSYRDAWIMRTAEENERYEDGIHCVTDTALSYEELKEIALGDNRYDWLNRRIEISEYLEIKGFTEGSSGNYLYFDTSYGSSDNIVIYISFSYKGDPDNKNRVFNSADDYVGSYFKVSGILTFHITNAGNIRIEILPQDSSDLIYAGNDYVPEGSEDLSDE